LVLRGAPVAGGQLGDAFPGRFIECAGLPWDAPRRARLAEPVRGFAGTVLVGRPAGRVDPARAAQALTDAVATLGLDVLPWSDGLRQWRARVQSLRAWMPDLGLPDLSDEVLLANRNAWLRPLFAGATRIDALSEDAL